MSAREQRIPNPEDYPVSYPVLTRWRDQDTYSHVNNAVYYEYVDTAVNGWLFEATGTDIRELDAIGVVVSSSCEFLAQIRFPEHLQVGLRVTRLGPHSVTYDVATFIARDEQLIPASRVTFVHVYVDRHTRQPVDVPAVVRTAVTKIASS